MKQVKLFPRRLSGGKEKAACLGSDFILPGAHRSRPSPLAHHSAA